MKRLLLLIDFQEGFMNKHTEHLRPSVQELVVDQFFDNVIATKFVNPPGGPWRTVIEWHGLQTKDEQKIAVSLPAKARVLEKSSYSLPHPVLIELTEAYAPGSIFLAGLETDVCVAICAAQLFDNDGAPFVISDCTGTTRGERHQRHALVTMRRIVGDSRVIELEDLAKFRA